MANQLDQVHVLPQQCNLQSITGKLYRRFSLYDAALAQY